MWVWSCFDFNNSLTLWLHTTILWLWIRKVLLKIWWEWCHLLRALFVPGTVLARCFHKHCLRSSHAHSHLKMRKLGLRSVLVAMAPHSVVPRLPLEIWLGSPALCCCTVSFRSVIPYNLLFFAFTNYGFSFLDSAFQLALMFANGKLFFPFFLILFLCVVHSRSLSLTI